MQGSYLRIVFQCVVLYKMQLCEKDCAFIFLIFSGFVEGIIFFLRYLWYNKREIGLYCDKHRKIDCVVIC